jgi:glucosyl-3-phosphoglycerate synthase
VVLPALNEQDTVAGVVASVLPLVGSVVDECVVVDSGSTDRTVAVAARAGARVVARDAVLSELPPLPGKGEVLWRSLAATDADLLVFLDSDLIDPDPGFVTALLGPMLCQPGVHLAKGFYRRPLRLESAEIGTGGGRVTELLARPLLAALRPELAGVIQPLGGEYAVTREFAESVPFAAGYGVEIGLLLDAHARYGLDGLAQVNLGVRKHRNRSLLQLGVMSRQILGTALARCAVPADEAAAFTQFVQVDGEWLPDATDVLIADRPPMREVLAARDR